MPEYVIVAETGSDITAAYARELGVELVPMHVSFGGVDHDDGILQPEVVYDSYRQTGTLPRTSGCSPHDFEVVFDRIHAERPEAHILHLAYSAVTTVSFASAQAAAKGRDYVTSIDTKNVSSGQRMVVSNTALWLRDSPDATLEEVEAYVADQIARTHMAFIPGDLDYLRAGGRLSNVAYLGATLLRIKPTVEIVDGRLVATKRGRGTMYKCAISLAERYLNEFDCDTSRVELIYSVGDAPDRHLAAVVDGMLERRGFEQVEWVKTGCVIGSHAGPGAFGIIVQERPRD